MTPLNSLPEPTQTAQSDVATPRFFLDNVIDANPDDGDWWLDIGGFDLPGALAV